ncbi:transmembrane protein 187 [Dipodomys spectabilis]|uniref:transmembrane protein 187 n=1 Tax=Dipodomys spectabilis TaxID=105255 RepID=UPI001C534862|nr:transmembrane protein 187 [Dipodomys spectabilis]
MKPESWQAICHVCVASGLCAATVYMGFFEDVFVQVGFEHYAEAMDERLPAFLAMPFNSLINLAYVLLGACWMWTDVGTLGHATELQRAQYLKDVFASMALVYGPVQWLRIWTQTHPAAVLDQWLTLPIFAWVVAWCLSIDRGWAPWLLLCIEGLSLSSYGLALLHPQGFEVALGTHVVAAVGQALRTHRRYGSDTSATYLALGMLSCLGFVLLKLYDHELAQWLPFQRLTGHFWSKVCDVLQFHFAFLFLTNLNTSPRLHPKEKMH